MDLQLHYAEQRTIPEQAAMLVQRALLRAIEADDALAPAHEAKVRNTLDHLRDARADPAMLRQFETMSCTLAELSLYRRQGRINAYRCALRRLRMAVTAA